MRLVQYDNGGQVGVGIEVGDVTFYTGYDDMLSLILDGDRGLAQAAGAAERDRPVRFDRLIAPLTNPGKLFGSGVNYRGHGDADSGYVPADEPAWDFIKLPSAIIGPDEPIVIPPADDIIRRGPGSPAPLSEFGFAFDYEVEFGVIIGKMAKNVTRDDALDHVFGYTIFNDSGARSVQFHNGQLDVGKNFDSSAPMGPCIVTKDDLADWQGVRIRSFVNGELRQDALVGDQINPPPIAIEWLSSVITLNPGDCLMTGAPGGSATDMDPPGFLKPGDVVICTASGIGELRNPVVAGSARTRPARRPAATR